MIASLSSLLVTNFAPLPSATSFAAMLAASVAPKTPQKPSQPRSMSRSDGVNSNATTSGTEVHPAFLNCRSPNDLETSRRPRSRPSGDTYPPLRSMRRRSGARMALCSLVRVIPRMSGGARGSEGSMDAPGAPSAPGVDGWVVSRASTALASPTLATSTVRPTTQQHTAVAPSCHCPSLSLETNSAWSVALNPATIARFAASLSTGGSSGEGLRAPVSSPKMPGCA
mmetsp:Transcript_35829/g.89447  ORF Transcript_35829/g.89447 Transcript_35829/m.89447 type:complete len:226 (+) Transcript_35829:1964-2641(+)